MKHLKTYENNNIFKKYLILNAPGGLSIFKVLKIFEDRGIMRVSIKQNFKHFKDTKTTKMNFSVKYIMNKVLFQSDNLKECSDMLPLLTKTYKYNI